MCTGLEPALLGSLITGAASVASTGVGILQGKKADKAADRRAAEALTAAENANKPGAVTAPNRREDTGANVFIGDAAKNARVSGRSTSTSSSTSSGDIFGNLGKAGLSL